MMSNRFLKRGSSFLLSMLFACQFLAAQDTARVTLSDTVAVVAAADSIVVETARLDSGRRDSVSFFNAIDYTLQRRKRPADKVEFKNTRFMDNTFLMLSGGIQRLAPWGMHHFDVGPDLSVSVGKALNPANMFRAGISAGYWNRNTDQSKLVHGGLQVDHLFNISSFALGYDPGRIFEVSTVEGIGYHLSSFGKEVKQVFEAHLGLQLKLHPFSRMDFVLEPRVTFYSDGVDHSGGSNWHKYDLAYGALAGINYRFTTSEVNLSSDSFFPENGWLSNTFVSFSGGVQAPFSPDGISLSNAVGPSANLSVGKWLMPLFGVQLSAYAGFNRWGAKERPGEYYLSAYAGGRAELLVDLLSFFTARQDNRFGVVAMAGVDFGKMSKRIELPYHKIKDGYVGATAALQLKYYVRDNIGIFLEPRILHIPYHLDMRRENSVVTERYDYNDKLWAVNVGLELRRASKTQIEEHNADGLFYPGFFVSAGGGTNVPLKMANRWNCYGYQAGAAFGYRFAPLSAVRLSADYAYSKTKIKGDDWCSTTVGIDYMGGLLGFFQGYDPVRPFDLEVVAGPVVTYDYTGKQWRFGGEAGLHLSYEVANGCRVYAEPLVRVYKRPFAPVAEINGCTIVPLLSAGISYSFW